MNEFKNKIFPNICKNEYIDVKISKKRRIVVFGDIHGDYKTAIEMLKLSETIKLNNNEMEWIGDDTYIVQVGDQIDNCRPINGMKCDHPKCVTHDSANDVKILKLFSDLNILAEKHGGKVISLLGNHEIMNSLGNLCYVSYQNVEYFKNYKDPITNQVFDNGEKGRKHAFAPGNEYGKLLGCTRMACVIIGSHLFVHAGIIDKLIDHYNIKNVNDLNDINIMIKQWLLGLYKDDKLKVLLEDQNKSMFWVRVLGMQPANIDKNDIKYKEKCSTINKTIEILNINDMMIGHTPQSFMHNEDINHTCSGQVWRVDNGSANAFDYFDKELTKQNKKSYNRRTQILEILNDNEYNVISYDDNNNIIRKKIIK